MIEILDGGSDKGDPIGGYVPEGENPFARKYTPQLTYANKSNFAHATAMFDFKPSLMKENSFNKQDTTNSFRSEFIET